MPETSIKILVPIDGSACSQRTLTWLADFLNGQTTELHLITVIPIIPEVPLSETDFTEADALLAKARSLFEKNGFRSIKTQSIAGFIAPTICEYANQQHITQIIMGSHSRHGIEKFLMGSVSSEVFKTAAQPVLIFNNTGKDAPSFALSHADEPHLKV